MGQFDKNNRIEFILNDIKSIQSALKQYRVLLREDEVVVDEVYNIDFVHLIDGVVYPLSIKNVDRKLIDDVSQISESYYLEEGEFHSTGAEGLFFAHCLEFEEILEEVVKTIKEIVNYSRRHNDTWEMWSDDCAVFGIDPIYMLAKKYPKYNYLLGSYLIPYWDMEHANYVKCYFSELLDVNGFDENILKTFCYCDNSEIRLVLTGQDWEGLGENAFDLDTYFRQNTDKYELFKTLLKERFLEQPFIQYTDSEYTDKPIEEFYKTILSSSENNNEDYYEEVDLEKMFISSSYENEAYLLQNQIEEYIGKPLTVRKEDEEEYDYDEAEMWEDFFINGFDNGEEMWNYIMYGEDDSILDEIEPVDCIKLAEEKNLKINSKFEWIMGEMDTLNSEFHTIFGSFMAEYYEEPEVENALVLSINGNDTTGRGAVICALDIMYRLMGKPVFTYDTYELIINSKVMKQEMFIEKYEENSLVNLSFLIAEFQNSSSVFSPQIDRISKYINLDREGALTLFKGELLNNTNKNSIIKKLSKDIVIRPNQVKLINNGLVIANSNVALVMALLYKDYQSRTMDNLSKFMIEYVESNACKIFYEIIKEDSSLNESDIEIVKKYVNGKPLPPRELMMKAMMGKEALTEEEKSMLNPNFEEVKMDTVLELLEEKLDGEIESEDPQKHYEIFSMFEDSISLLVTAYYIGGIKCSLPSTPKYKRLYNLLFELAPIKVMSKTWNYYCFSERYPVNNVNYAYDFKTDIGKVTKDKSKFLAWEILYDEERYPSIVDAYIEDETDSGFSFFTSESRELIEKALKCIPLSKQILFYEDIAKKDDTIIKDANEMIFYNIIPEFVKYARESCKKVTDSEIEKITNDIIKYINNEIEIEELNYTKEILKELDNRSYLSCRVNLLSEEKEDRMLKYMFSFGFDGVIAMFDRDRYDVDDYLELLQEYNIEDEYIIRFVFEYGEADEFISLLEKIDPYEVIAKMSSNCRYKAIEYAAIDKVGHEFIKKFSNDSSNRVRNLVNEILN